MATTQTEVKKELVMKLFYITCPDSEHAQKIAHQLLSEKLIACANILPQMQSMYWWKDKIENSSEAILLIKTQFSENLSRDSLFQRIEALHPYEVPCIMEIQIGDVNDAYLKWIQHSLQEKS